MRREFTILALLALFVNLLGYFYFPQILWSLIIVVPLALCGFRDMFQSKHTILRNFPLLGHFRYLLELIRPEINQYFIESNVDGVPLNREQRSLVYQRAKKQLDTLPFGTQMDVYKAGYEWFNHSISPVEYKHQDLRVTIGEGSCEKPYSASILNIGAMSYGALSKTAIMSLNAGAKIGNFAHNTGEGGLSPYHLEPGGDIIWQIGTGYFGCRKEGGGFSPEKFQKNASLPQVKMIEVKLSQGAKPGHGGILPAVKVNQEIANIRGVPVGKTVFSPPYHKAFSTPIEMIQFIAKLRELSGGKPVGFKLCVGKRREFIAVCKAMVELNITPDFIAVDGGEGGTGAAPLEFSNSIGCPLREGLVFVHNALVGYSLRSRVKVIASGKILTGFDLLSRLSIGADICYSARGMMLSLGCIQALRCNSNHCPAGIATQNPWLYKGIVVEDKKQRVANYHQKTIESAGEMLGAMGLKSSQELKPWHLMRRVNYNEVLHYADLYPFLKDGDLLKDKLPPSFARACKAATADSFNAVESVG